MENRICCPPLVATRFQAVYQWILGEDVESDIAAPAGGPGNIHSRHALRPLLGSRQLETLYLLLHIRVRGGSATHERKACGAYGQNGDERCGRFESHDGSFFFDRAHKA